jgi:nucleotide-binding universal stress UspA family protein/predicted transcriptional regulator
MMTRTLIVPLAGPRQDPERVSEAILPIARALACQSQAVVLVAVIELPLTRAETVGTIDELWGQELDAYLRDVAETFPDTPVQTVVRQNTSISSEVARLCSSLSDPLVVMSSQGRKGLQRALRGSVAFETVQALSCPVLIIPVAYAADQPLARGELNEVLIPLDGSPLAEGAIIAGLLALEGAGFNIHLLKVTNETGDEEEIRRYLQGICEDLEARGYRVSWSIRHGKPAEQIVAVAQELDVQLITMATRGRRGFERLIYGSITEDVVRDAGVPVLVVRGGPEAVAAANERQARRLGYPSVEAREVRYRALAARDIMSSPAITVVQATPLGDVARLMLEHRIGCVPVVDNDGKIAGIITQSDFAGHRESILFSDTVLDPLGLVPKLDVAGALTAIDVATRPVITAEEGDPVSGIVELMAEHDFSHVPVVRNGIPLGIVSHHDLLRMVADPSAIREAQTSDMEG